MAEAAEQYIKNRLGGAITPSNISYDEVNISNYKKLKDDDGVGSTASSNVGTTNVSPGITGNCTTLANNIAAAETALTNIINENLPQARKFAAQARAIRELRDDMEIEAFGLLQGAAASRKEIDRLTTLLNDLREQDLESYG